MTAGEGHEGDAAAGRGGEPAGLRSGGGEPAGLRSGGSEPAGRRSGGGGRGTGGRHGGGGYAARGGAPPAGEAGHVRGRRVRTTIARGCQARRCDELGRMLYRAQAPELAALRVRLSTLQRPAPSAPAAFAPPRMPQSGSLCPASFAKSGPVAPARSSASVREPWQGAPPRASEAPRPRAPRPCVPGSLGLGARPRPAPRSSTPDGSGPQRSTRSISSWRECTPSLR